MYSPAVTTSVRRIIWKGQNVPILQALSSSSIWRTVQYSWHGDFINKMIGIETGHEIGSEHEELHRSFKYICILFCLLIESH